jgi:hypothetical protein
MKLKSFYCALLLTQITACGGGSSDSDTPSSSVGSNPPTETTPPAIKAMTINSSIDSISLAENEHIKFIISVNDETGPLLVDVSQYKGIGSVTTTISGSVISIHYSIPELDNNISEVIPVVLKDNDDEVIFNIPTIGINTSGEAILSKVKSLRDTIAQRTTYNDILLAFKSYTTLLYINGQISKSTSIKQNENLISAKNEAFRWGFDVYMDVNVERINERITEYVNGEASEAQLQESLNSIRDKLTFGASYLIGAANNIAEQTPNIPVFTSYQVSVSSLGVSGFVDNEEYGSWEGDNWVFKDEYALLSSVISSSCFCN